VGTRRERIGIGWKKKKECAGCAVRRERQSTHVERMRRNEREGGKGTGRNTERRRKRDRMDERGVEEEGKDRKGEGVGNRKKNVGLIVFFWNCYFYVFNYCNQEFERP
jgi:hypothetical protein